MTDSDNYLYKESQMIDIENRIEVLEQRHEQLDRRLQRMQSDPQSESLDITDLKKQKLACKDEIQKLLAK